MADPTTPTDPTTTVQPLDPAVQQSYDDFNLAAERSQQNMTALQGVFSGTNNTLKSLSEGFVAAGNKLENVGDLTTSDSTKFGMLATAVLGAKEAFTSFAGVDTSKLSTFGNQIQELQASIERSPAFKTAKKIFDDAIDSAKRFIALKPGDRLQESLGADMIKRAEKAFKDAAGGISDTAKAMLISADNGLRLQNALFQLTAQAGDTDTLFNKISDTFIGVGDDLSNLNTITAKYQDVMFNAMQATGIESEETMAQFMATITKMPGGFKELMSSMDLGKSTNILTASIQYATGAGRNQAEVFEDMKKAVSEYGVSVQDALKFTANITSVSNTLHAQIEDVKSALMGSAESFKFFAMGEDGARKMTQGMTESMNQYVGSLTSVGVPVQNALDMFKNYTNQMKGMTQAQEAFMSSMSGGPGGLMGGFQIDAMIKRGNFAGLQKKAEETIRKMTGPIVSFEDAQKSQGAAAKYTQQIQILQQGPLGGMARTRAEAESLLEAMRSGRAGARVKDPTDVLKETVEKGAKIEQLSYTELKEININTKRVAAQAGLANLATIQRSFAARTGTGGGADEQGRAINIGNQERLRAFQQRGMTPPEGSPTTRALKELGMTISDLPTSIKDSAKSAIESVKKGAVQPIQLSGEQIGKNSDNLKMGIATDVMHPNMQLPTTVPGNEFSSAGKQVGAVVPTATTAAPANLPNIRNTAGISGMTPNQPLPVTFAPGTGITVNFTGVCPHCGKGVHTSQQADIQSSPSMAANK